MKLDPMTALRFEQDYQRTREQIRILDEWQNLGRKPCKA